MSLQVLVAARGPTTTARASSMSSSSLSSAWQLTQMPDFIDKLRELVDGQFNDADRASCGLCEYALGSRIRNKLRHCGVLAQPVGRPAAEGCRSCLRRPGVTTSTSTDGFLTIPTAPGGSKKPNQVKRARNARQEA